MARYRYAKKNKQPPKRNTLRLPLPPPSADRQMEDFLGCCEYSDEQFEANKKKNLLNAAEFSCSSSPIAMWYIASQKEEFEHQRAQYTSHCQCRRDCREDQQYVVKTITNNNLGLKDDDPKSQLVVGLEVEKESEIVLELNEVEETVEYLLFRTILFENEVSLAEDVNDTVEDIISKVLAIEGQQE